MEILKVKTEKRLIGNIGELAAVKHLKKHGYKILSKNYVLSDAEIDIIAENREYIAFVEVKTRTKGKENPCEARPASSVTPDKQRKIINCARYFLATYDKKKKVRFDVIEVLLDGEKRVAELNHLDGAFNVNTAYSR